VGSGLTQQLAGPLLFNAGIGLNVDPIVAELWRAEPSRRGAAPGNGASYALSVFYSPLRESRRAGRRRTDFWLQRHRDPLVPYRPVVARSAPAAAF